MSHALLLRLFINYFSLHVALQYLALYSDNIGITYYITSRLRQLDTKDLADVWGFICHLLVTRPSKSRALECFVVDIAHRSTHIAMITLWFMQASLRDLSGTRHDSKSFLICQRILHQCHEIIFGDLPPPVPAPYSSICSSFQSRFTRKKIKHHVEPSLVGLGVVLAGAPAMPMLTEIVGQVAIEQGRIDDEGTGYRSIDRHGDEVAPAASPNLTKASLDSNCDDHDDADDLSDDSQHTPSPGFMSNEDKTVRPRAIGPAQTAPSLPLHLSGIRKSRLSEDPLGQLDTEQIVSPYQSSPSVSASRHPPRSVSTSYADGLLQSYDGPSQTHLLRSHYCRSEIQFLLVLESISNRLLEIPRPARISALRAELTALNHQLPAEVCMPMWCSSSDSPRPVGGSQPHHRIVRIPPGESVVLNSAERAPYVLLIEILNDDLDFDPNKRANKDVLKKIVVKEHEKKGASKELISFPPLPSRHSPKSDSLNDTDVVAAAVHVPVFSPVFTASSPVTPSSPVESDEEMDLVEQLYGSDQSLRSRPVDLSDSIVLPPTPKNRELDMVAWSRSSSIPPSPSPERGAPMARALSSTSDSCAHLSPFPDHVDNSPALSLDEYSERMRTAAIMLAQLNANLVREPVTNGASSESQSQWGPISWLPGSSWLTTPGDHSSKNSPGLGPQDQPSQHLQPARMRLQLSEASAIRERIMQEMLALEAERMERMRENREMDNLIRIDNLSGRKTAEDEGIIRREINKADPSAVVLGESWAAKKSRIRHGSPYGHLANWDCVSVIVKTGGDLRQEQLATHLIREFQRIWEEEKCQCWARYFHILITGGSSGLVETITDAPSIHSIKKAEYARRIAQGRLGHVTLFDHFKSTYGDPSSAKFIRAQRNFAKSLAGYSVITYLLQIKDRHNGNILLDRDGHLVHIDFGFILSNTPGNIGFEAAPFKFPSEYIEVLGGATGQSFLEFRRLFREGFEAARKHCDRIITLVELMQKDSALPCFAVSGEQTANQLRERFQPSLTHSLIGEHVDRLIDSSLGSHWTRLYDSFQYYSQSIL
ncbi:kinase-like protein [Armillaria nabsnona]|nr:kinase-like protein [Armillaria nabsnona]